MPGYSGQEYSYRADGRLAIRQRIYVTTTNGCSKVSQLFGAMIATLICIPLYPPAALFIIHHNCKASTQKSADIMDQHNPLSGTHAGNNERIYTDRIYAAPANCHRVAHLGTTMRVIYKSRKNSARPAIDPLYRC
jgi:chemotaxis response regulator CheB